MRVIAGAPEDIFAAAPVDAKFRARRAPRRDVVSPPSSPGGGDGDVSSAKRGDCENRTRDLLHPKQHSRREREPRFAGGGSVALRGGGAGFPGDSLGDSQIGADSLGYPRVCYLVAVEVKANLAAVDSFLRRASLARASRSLSATRPRGHSVPAPARTFRFRRLRGDVARVRDGGGVARVRRADDDASLFVREWRTRRARGRLVVGISRAPSVPRRQLGVFRRMFASGMRESAAGRVHLPADAAVSVAAIAAFVRYARTGAFPAEAPAAEEGSLCRRFGANPATKAACRAVEEARDDGADAMTLLTIAQDLGVDLARVLEDEDQETDEEEEEEEKEKKEKKGARETPRRNVEGTVRRGVKRRRRRRGDWPRRLGPRRL